MADESLDALAGQSSEAQGADIPPFETEENKPIMPPGYYLFALGHALPKYDEGNGQLLRVEQEVWVLRFDGALIGDLKDWRIAFNDKGELFMPSYKGTKKIEFFPNPKLKPKQKWLTSAFYKIFPNVLVQTPGEVPGNPKPTTICSWKAVTGHYGQFFHAELVTNNYKDAEGNKKSSIKFDYLTMMLTDKKISIEQMLLIEGRYNELKAQDDTSSSTVSAPSTKIEDDLPF